MASSATRLITQTIELANYRDVVAARQGLMEVNTIRRVGLEAIIDPGCHRLFLPRSIAARLGLVETELMRVAIGAGSYCLRPVVADVGLELLGRRGVFKAIIERDRRTAALGDIVLSELDLFVDNNRIHRRIVEIE